MLLNQLLTFTIILTSVLVVSNRNPVISITYLVLLFLSASLYLIINGVVFIGITYVVLYVGAISVLFLFIIMMIDIQLQQVTQSGLNYTKNIPLGISIGSLFILLTQNTHLPYLHLNNSIFSIFSNPLNTVVNNITSTFLISADSDLHIKSSPYLLQIEHYPDILSSTYTQIHSIGLNLYTIGILPMLMLSFILLLSICAPIFINKTHTS